MQQATLALEGYATLPTNCLYGWLVGSIEPWLVDGITWGFSEFLFKLTLKFGSSTAYQLPLWLVGSFLEAASQKEHSPAKAMVIFNDELLVSSTVLHMVVMESLEGFSEFPFNYGWLVGFNDFLDFHLSKIRGKLFSWVALSCQWVIGMVTTTTIGGSDEVLPMLHHWNPGRCAHGQASPLPGWNGGFLGMEGKCPTESLWARHLNRWLCGKHFQEFLVS